MRGLRTLVLILAFDLRRLLRQLLPLVAVATAVWLVVCLGALAVVPLVPRPTVRVVAADPAAREAIAALGRGRVRIDLASSDDTPADLVVVVPADPIGDPWTVRADTREHARVASGFVRVAQAALREDRALDAADLATLAPPTDGARALDALLRGFASERARRILLMAVWMYTLAVAVGAGERAALDRDEGLFGLLQLGTPAHVLWLVGVVRVGAVMLLLAPAMGLAALMVAGPRGAAIVLAMGTWTLAQGLALGTILGAAQRESRARIPALAALAPLPVGLAVFAAPEPVGAVLAWMPVLGTPLGVGGSASLVQLAATAALLPMGAWAYVLREPLLPAVRRTWRRA